jgi:hypothetical protein
LSKALSRASLSEFVSTPSLPPMPPQDESNTFANKETPTKIPVVLDIMVFVLSVDLFEWQI